MKSYVFAALLCSAGLAHASERIQLFDRPHADQEATRRADAIGPACKFSMLSRIGPSAQQRAACDAAEDKLLSLGKRAVPAAFAAIDAASSSYDSSVSRYYDVLARVGDASVVETLIRAYEKLDAGPITDRNEERYTIESTLERLTKTQLGDHATAHDWRVWLDTQQATKTAKPSVDKDGKPMS